MRSILVFFHCPSNTGYAIDTYEERFYRMALELVDRSSNIHFAYPDTSEGLSDSLPADFSNIFEFDPFTEDDSELARLKEYLSRHQVDFAFGVDQPLRQSCYRIMRQEGVEGIVSYWGAPMSSLYSGPLLWARKLEVRLASLTTPTPDHFIFESRAMAESATLGRGIPEEKVSVVYLGVDTEEFRPEPRGSQYLTRELGIPPDATTVVYSGHFEERKGVSVLARAAIELTDRRGRDDFHLLLLGNKNGESQPIRDILKGTEAASHVTFGGYRNDLNRIFPHCALGTIASTGWDSFTVSALEMASCGLPLLVSDLQGLVETIEKGTTGFVFPPGDHQALADRIELLLDNTSERESMARAARHRILEDFSVERQVSQLADTCRRAY